jgi:hypothetical protein
VLDRPTQAADQGSSDDDASPAADGPARPDSPDDVLLIDFH